MATTSSSQLSVVLTWWCFTTSRIVAGPSQGQAACSYVLIWQGMVSGSVLIVRPPQPWQPPADTRAPPVVVQSWCDPAERTPRDRLRARWRQALPDVDWWSQSVWLLYQRSDQ